MDLDAMITRAAPSRNVLLDGPDSMAAARLRERIISQQPVKRRRYAARGLTAVAIAVAAVIAVVAVIPGSPGPLGHPDSAAAAVLGQAAVTASRQPATPAGGPSQYEYVKVIEEQRGANGITRGGKTVWQECDAVQVIQYWVAPDGSGRLSAGGGPSCEFPTSETFTAGQADDSVYPDAAALPTDPAALEQIIVRKYEGGKADAGATFQFAGTILQSGGPPKVRAALYRLIESLPGVQLLGSMTDKLGRHGIAVGYTQYGTRDTLIFDPTTSAVFEREGVIVDPAEVGIGPGELPVKVGEVFNYTVYVTSGVVDSDTATPAAG